MSGEQFGGRASWETREYVDAADPVHVLGEDDLDLEALSPRECSIHLFDMIVAMKMAGTISAKQACLLAYWVKRAGVGEPVSDLAFPPPPPPRPHRRALQPTF